jgi:hypothetical protein
MGSWPCYIAQELKWFTFEGFGNVFFKKELLSVVGQREEWGVNAQCIQSFKEAEAFGGRQWEWLHSSVNGLSAAELCSKWFK